MFFGEFQDLIRNNPHVTTEVFSRSREGTKKELFERFLQIHHSPMEFLKCVRTKDEVDRKNPIKTFPYHLEYIQWFVRLWQQKRFIAVPKSRRMKMSWTNIALSTWDTIFHRATDWAFVSKKEDDSNELVKRGIFIYQNLNEELLPRELLPEISSKYCYMGFEEIDSRVRGYPSGADQLRQFTMTGILGDECAFWPNAEEMYKGAIPTLEGTDENSGGRFIMISSTAPGFFKRLVYDKLETLEEFDVDRELNLLKPKSPMEGVTIWTNPKNRFTVFDLHYTADPVKRTETWKKAAKSRLSLKDWKQEYEKTWETFVGLPVYGDFSPTVHAKQGLEYQAGLPLLRGWDFGLTPACVIAQLQGNQLLFLKEFTELNMGADRFSDIVLPQCEQLFPGMEWIDFVDPAGANRDQSDEGQCTAILDSKGLKCIPGEITFTRRRKAMEEFLIRFEPKTGEACFLVDPLNCPVLYRGFQGGYRYADGVLEKEPSKVKPLKDEHSHPHDAAQYIASGILYVRKNKKSYQQIPSVAYNWNRQEFFNRRPMS